MDAVILGGRLILAAVFAVSAGAKLADVPGSRQSLRDFHVPAPLVPSAAILLPLIEIAVSVALLTASLWRAGAATSLTLLVLFVGVMAVSLAQGRRAYCHCFGQLHSSPVGTASIARNVALTGIAALILLTGRGSTDVSMVAWIGPLTAFQRAVVGGGVAVIALLAWNSILLARVLREQASARSVADAGSVAAPATAGEARATALTVPEVAGHPVGSPAADFGLATLRGDVVHLRQLRELEKPVVLFFSDPGCGPCKAMFPDIAKWQREYETEMTLVVISRGDKAENAERAREAGIGWILLQKDREVAQAYGVFGTPSAVRIDVDGALATRLAQGEGEIRQLIAATIADFSPASTAESLPEHAMPVKADCVEDELMSDGTIVLYNSCTNKVLTLNGTAALVWESCDGEHDASRIAGELRDVFPDAKDIEADVTRILASLLQSSMILAERPAAATAGMTHAQS